jgi:PEGA domain
MRRSRFLLALIVPLTCSPGCATIVKGRYQDLTVNSNPPGATFEVDGISGTTPAIVPVERKLRSHTVVITKPGYETAQIRVGRDLNLWTAGNIIWGLFGAPIGVGVDLINGSAYKLASNEVQVSLQPGSSLANQGAAVSPTVLEAQHTEPNRVEPPAKPNK